MRMRSLLAILLLLALSPLAQAQITVGYTNWNGVGTGAATTVSTTSGTTQATGSTFVLAVINTPSATSVPTVTDNMGNNAKWTLASSINTYPGQPRTLALYYCINCAGGAGHVVTATWTGAGNGSIGFVEFKAFSTGSFDIAPTGVNNTTGTGPIAAPSITTSAANEIVVDVAGTYGSSALTWGDSGAPWSIATSQSTSSYQDGIISWQLVSTSGTAVSDSFTYTSGPFTAALSMGLKTTAGSTCTHAGYTSGGATATPNGTSGSYLGKTGGFVTPDCSSVNYWQPTIGNFGVN